MDLLSIVPFTYFFQTRNYNRLARLARLNKLYRLVKMFKMFRMFKMVKESGKIYRFLNQVLKLKANYERLFYFVLLMMLFCHIMACMWYFIAKLDDLGPETWVVRYGYQD